MTSEQLRDYVSDLVLACGTRITGPGNEQYSKIVDGEPVQLVEQLPLADICQWAREELQDLIVYAAALHLRFERLEDSITTHKITHTYR